MPVAEMLTTREAIARYAEDVGKAPAADVRRYIEWQGAAEGRDLDGYLRHLLKAGKARGTADKVRRIVQAFYRHFDLPAPKVRGWRFNPREESKHEDLDIHTVGHMIDAATEHRLPPHLAAILCLSTVYGLRSGEIAAVGPSDLDFAGERIFARTEKHGRRVWQWLPPPIHPWLRGWQGPQTPARIQAAFGHVWATVSDGEKPKGLGWHSIRRSLVVGLCISEVPEPAIGHFLRWADGGRRDGMSKMVDWYANPSGTVGADGQVRVPEAAAGQREEDPLVFQAHPFLPLWS